MTRDDRENPIFSPVRNAINTELQPLISRASGRSFLATCPTGFGGGGMGQHLAQVRDDAVADGFIPRIICHGGIGEPQDRIDNSWEPRLFKYPPLRFRPDLAVWLKHMVFDRQAAARLTPADTVTAFMGGALETFRRARAMGARRLVLEMPTSHPANVMAMHALALRQHPLERSWMGNLYRRRVEKEMLLADEIRANSNYTAESVIAQGIPKERITRRQLATQERFSRIQRVDPGDGTKTAVFIGSLTVFKGVPLLVEAFRSLQGNHLRLALVGGWASRGMRQFMESAMRADSRILLLPGDPAPVLAKADIAFHPSWDDGWGYAPAEALTAGVPVVVSDHTGMMEVLTATPENIVPAGDIQAWKRRLQTWAGRLS